MSSSSVFLDIDHSLLEKSLLVTKDPHEDELKNLYPSISNNIQSKLIRPLPGFCMKAKEVGTNRKLFLNICQTDAIPAPRDISETELSELFQNAEDEPINYRIPMSIGDLRLERDKKGAESSVCDVAINTVFYDKVVTRPLFQEFLVAVAFEGFGTKHQIEVGDERILLKNRKTMGNLQEHRIQQREMAEKMGQTFPSVPSVQELVTGNVNSGQTKKLVEVLEDTSDKDVEKPEFRLFIKDSDKNRLFAEVYLPYIHNSKEIKLDVGEDRILLESEPKKYFLDIFHEFNVKQNEASSSFNKGNKFLTITMPILVN